MMHLISEAMGRGILRIAALHPAILLGLSGLVMMSLMAMAAWKESSTFDEGAHLAAAYTALTLDDYRLLPEQPPLGRRLAAIPLLFQPVHLPSQELWQEADYSRYGFSFLYQSGNAPDSMLRWSRAAMMFWVLLLAGSIYAFALEAFGPTAGLLSLIFTTFNPTLLAHGCLVTTDMSVAALLFLAVISFDRFLRRASPFNSAASGILGGAALATKFSAIAMVPIFGLLILLAGWRRLKQPSPPSVDGRSAPRSGWPRRAGLVILALFFAWATLWGAYGFRFSPFANSSETIQDPSVLSLFQGWSFSTVRRIHLVPEAFVWGLAELEKHAARGHPAFALGQFSTVGWWWYFPLVFLLKTPLSALAAMAWSGRAALKSSRALAERLLFLIVPTLIILTVSMMSPLNIGIRHLLPIFPFLLAFAGSFAVPGPADPSRKIALGFSALFIGAMAECGFALPDFLAYFNAPSCLLAPRHELFVDSNLDWGQDLGRLKEYMDRQGIPEVKLSYFGGASPRALGLNHQVLPGLHLYSIFEPEWKEATPLKPGDFVAVSASNFSGCYLQDRNYYRDLLRDEPLIANIGHSILLFRLKDPRSERLPPR